MINPEAKIKNMNNLLIDFYSERAQPQNLVWSTQKLTDIRAVGSEGWNNSTLINYKFQALRGSEKKLINFTCADLPLMNPFDWFSIFWSLSKNKEAEKYTHYLNHVRSMLRLYISEIGKEDFEVAKKFDRTVEAPHDIAENIDQLRDGSILPDPWSVVYKIHKDGRVQRRIFYVNEKHLYSNFNLNTIVAKMEINTKNNTANKKHISDTIKWWMMVRMFLTNEVENVFV